MSDCPHCGQEIPAAEPVTITTRIVLDGKELAKAVNRFNSIQRGVDPEPGEEE